VFIHFSARFSVEQIEEQLDAQLPEHLRRRVTPLLAGCAPSHPVVCYVFNTQQKSNKRLRSHFHSGASTFVDTTTLITRRFSRSSSRTESQVPAGARA